jgi:anion-transporting  ArsA/GET3 family ATPase
MSLAKLVLVMGKGGVGKTTVARAMAESCAQQGLSCAAVELGAGAAPTTEHDPLLWAQKVTIAEEDALLETCSEVFGSLSAAKLLLGNTAIARLLGVMPGVREYSLIVAARACLADFDRVVVDMPATGHGLAWLSAAGQLSQLVPYGRARAQADALDAALRDPESTSYILVTLPEPLVVAESNELADALFATLGVRVYHTIVNRVPSEAPCTDDTQLARLEHDDPPLHEALAELSAWSRQRARALSCARAVLAKGAATSLIQYVTAPVIEVVQRALGPAGVWS